MVVPHTIPTLSFTIHKSEFTISKISVQQWLWMFVWLRLRHFRHLIFTFYHVCWSPLHTSFTTLQSEDLRRLEMRNWTNAWGEQWAPATTFLPDVRFEQKHLRSWASSPLWTTLHIFDLFKLLRSFLFLCKSPHSRNLCVCLFPTE